MSAGTGAGATWPSHPCLVSGNASMIAAAMTAKAAAGCLISTWTMSATTSGDARRPFGGSQVLARELGQGVEHKGLSDRDDKLAGQDSLVAAANAQQCAASGEQRADREPATKPPVQQYPSEQGQDDVDEREDVRHPAH